MNNLRSVLRISLQGRLVVFAALFVSMISVTCSPAGGPPGVLQGTVTIGPIFPVERPGQNPPVPPQVFESRKIDVYDQSGKKLITEMDIHQIDQSDKGTYQVQLPPGVYTVDIKRTSGIGGSRDVPKQVLIKSGQVVTLDINIDTGIR